MSNYLVTLRDGSEFYIDESQSRKVTNAIEGKRNFYIQDNYLSWTEVKGVRKMGSDSEQGRISAGSKYCGKCEKGWVTTERGFIPCNCNQLGMQIQREYRDYLENKLNFSYDQL